MAPLGYWSEPLKNLRAGDTTRTARAVAHLERLEEAKGKRLLVDLDAPGREALEALLALGFGATQKEVVIKALIEAVVACRKKAIQRLYKR